MLIKSPKRWEIRESEATPESVYLNRRTLMKSMGLGAIGLTASTSANAGIFGSLFGSDEPIEYETDPTADLYPVTRNPKFAELDRELTPEEVNAAYNNFYEFGSSKDIARIAQEMPLRPWMVTFDGMVEKEKTVDIDTLIKAMPLEERLYRLRCVEAWSMTIPWTGFPMAELVKFAAPLSGAKYVQMQTFQNPEIAPGQRQSWYPWPYTEGLTMAEASHELAFMVTGTYGHPALKQHGAPLRLAVPWKFGFKSIKSITRFTFTDKMPVSYWTELQAREYGFWANVNPEVDHPRWSQATERVLQTGKRVPTLLYNGYAEEVAGLYKDLQGEVLFR